MNLFRPGFRKEPGLFHCPFGHQADNKPTKTVIASSPQNGDAHSQLAALSRTGTGRLRQRTKSGYGPLAGHLPSKQDNVGSIPRIRSNSGVSEHLVPTIGRGNGWALCAGSMLWRSGRTGWACHPPRSGTAELEFAPVTEPVYVPVLETGFWEFDSPLGHQFHSVRLLVRSPVFQAGQTGSIPVRCTRQWRCACA